MAKGMADSKHGASEAGAGAAARPHPVIDPDICKGCGRCVVACPQHVLRLADALNRQGVHPAEYLGEGCTGCAICFYNCPEMYALEVHTPPRPKAGAARAADANGKPT